MTEDTITALDENTRRYYLDVMGIQCWELVQGNAGSSQAEETGTALQQLETDIQQCTKCQLHASRKQAIAGRGNPLAELMFVLLSPDMKDDASGLLCSGEADTLFTKMLSAINIPIDDVFITSLLKCGVPAQHTVSTTELHYCKDYLKQQVQLIQPKLLVILGETAARCMLQQNTPLDDLRALINTELNSNITSDTATISKLFESVPLFVSYSPQELIHKPENKRNAWLDLQQLQKILETW